jgi:hypothetical protein
VQKLREFGGNRAWRLGARGCRGISPDCRAGGIVAGLLVAGACICWGFDNQFTALIDGLTPSQSTLIKGTAAGLVNFALGAYLAPLRGFTIFAVALPPQQRLGAILSADVAGYG